MKKHYYSFALVFKWTQLNVCYEVNQITILHGKETGQEKMTVPSKMDSKILSNWLTFKASITYCQLNQIMPTKKRQYLKSGPFKVILAVNSRTCAVTTPTKMSKTLPVSLQYPLGNGITYLIEHNLVIGAAYKKLVLREMNRIIT